MKHRILAVLSFCVLLAVIDGAPIFDAQFRAAAQGRAIARLRAFDEVPDTASPVSREHLFAHQLAPGNINATVVITSNNRGCLMNWAGVTSHPFQPLGTAYRGPVTIALTAFGGDGSGPADAFFAAAADPSTQPVVLFGMGTPPTPQGDVSLPSLAANGFHMAVGDITADHTPEVAIGSGPGVPGAVMVGDLTRADSMIRFFPFGEGFTGGVHVAMADLNGDRIAELVVSQQTGGGEMQVYQSSGGLDLFRVGSGRPYGHGFSGGVRVATADLNNDGAADIITGQGSGGTHVRAFMMNADDGIKVLANFFAFEPTLTGGVSVASGLNNSRPAILATSGDKLRVFYVDESGVFTFDPRVPAMPFGPGNPVQAHTHTERTPSPR